MGKTTTPPADPPGDTPPRPRAVVADTPEKVAALLAADEVTAPATPADVAQAEQEADEAAALVDALERRVVDGDEDITPEEIANAEQLGRFARLRAKATQVRAERTARANRLRACDELRAEILAYADTSGPRFTGLLRDVEQAVNAFTTAVNERNAITRGWYQRMRELSVPDHLNPLPVPPAEHGQLGLVPGTGTFQEQGRALAAGRRRVPVRVDAGGFLTRLMDALKVERPRVREEQLTRLYEALGTLDRHAPDIDPGIRYFRGSGGSVFQVGAEQLAAIPEGHHENQWQRQIKTGELVEITRREAFGQ
ncbi:hypothetical protein DPM19_18160 [Actinomadura craniellae]|uniref:Uncharacterized protein n=1 Tax=Actinomadura craniellae TaxID=2231787 RepID=A0A365H5U1_9ACTN|nr:hypothetical protein [Actinomadura craniellae]RAY13603.1 hypothetical protein DPM19_18160 [Actinomadura craniellae]